MKIPALRLIGLLLLLTVALVTVWGHVPNLFFNSVRVPVSVCASDACFDVEVVKDKVAMERGLQGRTGLVQGHGMLFVFTTDDRHRFWMKDMKIPLDIIWIRQDGTIVSVGEDLPACTTQDCSVYAPSEPARYVLEITTHNAAQYGFTQGRQLTIKGL